MSGQHKPLEEPDTTVREAEQSTVENVGEANTSGSERVSRKPSKPKALEFWETLETMDQPPPTAPRTDFRYNTIHRMSMGRRMLPQPPPKDSSSQQNSSSQRQDSRPDIHHLRSQSLDRTMMDTSASDDRRMRNDGSSLNSR